MNKCPHCGKSTIGIWVKWRANQLAPTRCSHCRGQSFVPHAVSGGIFVGSLMFLMAAGFASSALQNIWILVGGAITSAAFYAWRWAHTALTPTGTSAVDAVVKRNTRFAAMWVLIATLFN